MSRRAFTLIELLVVIAILAVLAVVVVLTLNPAGLLQESRDNNRVSDMATINTAINLYASDATNLSLGSSSVLYVSIPDPSATSTAGDQCQGLSGLPTLPAGYAYQCAASSTYRLTNGTGWIPINFSADSFGTPLGSLPVDPTNTTSSGLYYEYLTNGSKYEVTASFESQKYLKAQAQSDGGIDPTRVEEGSSLSLLPGAEGLVGYWPFNEGAGTVAQDGSGGGNNATWYGTLPYYSTSAKVGPYAGVFDGSTDFASTTSATNLLPTTNTTIMAWIKIGSTTSAFTITGRGDTAYAVPGYLFAYIGTVKKLEMWSGSPNDTFIQTTNSISIEDNTWHQVAVVVTNSSTPVFYVDGTAYQSTLDWYETPYNLSGWPFTIGVQNTAAGSGLTNFFKGSMDDLRVYDTALTGSQMQAIYNAEK